MNSTNDLVGIDQLCMTDHESPSIGIGGSEVELSFTPYIFFRASENANLVQIKNIRLDRPQNKNY